MGEQIHIDAALEQQKQEHQKTLDKAVSTTMQHIREEARLEQERKVEEPFAPLILQTLPNQRRAALKMYLLLLPFFITVELCLCA